MAIVRSEPAARIDALMNSAIVLHPLPGVQADVLRSVVQHQGVVLKFAQSVITVYTE